MKWITNASLLFLLVSSVGAQVFAQAKEPIIDMHLHAMQANSMGPPGQPMCPGGGIFHPWTQHEPLRSPMDLYECSDPIISPDTDDELMRRTLDIMVRHNVIGVASGPQVETWRQSAPKRIIPGLLTDFGSLTPDALRSLLEAEQIKVLGEITTQYSGHSPSSLKLDPYFELAESFGVPVGIHVGLGPPGQPLRGGGMRASLGRPLELEELLVRHPMLRIYVMHAGWPFVDELIALMYLYPQVYAGLGAISYILLREEFNHFLQRLIGAGLEKRILFGSDQAVWPETLEYAIESIETADYLTEKQKRDILYNNAARFLRLSDEEVAGHHAQ